MKDDHFAKLTPFGKRGSACSATTATGSPPTSPGLLSEGYRAAAADSVVIRPHFRRSLCFTCHANTDDYALRDEDVNALCDRCHASGKILANIHPLRKVPPKITVPKGWPLTDGALTCLTCHDQGHEDQPQRRWMLHGGPYASPRAVCRNCHSTADLENSRIHQEINEGKSCEMCHKTRPQPGKDTIKTVTFIADPDLLCLRCHDQNAADGSVHHGGVIGREVEDGHIPAELPLFNGRVICATCHNPHLRDATGSRLREYLGIRFCICCHRAATGTEPRRAASRPSGPLDGDPALAGPENFEPDGHRVRGEQSGRALGPLHRENAAALRIVLKPEIGDLGRSGEPVEVGVEERHRAGVFVDEGVGGADRLARRHPEARRKTFHESRLACAERPDQRQHRSRRERGDEAPRDRRGLLRGRGV